MTGMDKSPACAAWDIDFSLALRNRTGKYFVGRDVIEAAGPRVRTIRYGRYVLSAPPTGGLRRLVELSARLEQALRRRIPALGAGLRSGRPVLHLDPYTAVLYRVGPADLVLCHDMGPITHPELFDPNAVRLYLDAYARIVEGGCGMVFVSAASRDAFAALYGAMPQMKVIYPPLRAGLSGAAPEPVAGVRQPYLLTVGSIGCRKNQAASIRAFASSSLAKEGIGYVLCGSREPGAAAVEELAQVTPGVRLLPYVSDGELAWLYRNASGFVLASRLEGFGVPVVEAIANGLVPLISKDSVLEEVAGPAALTADPTSEVEIARGLRTLAEMGKDQRERRVRELSRSLERFNPEAFRTHWQVLLDTHR